MKLKSALFVPLLLAVSLVFALPAMALPSSEKWESYTSGDDSEYEVYGNIWFAQTFAVGTEAHSISQVRFKAYREGSPGTITASVRETSAGLPTGSDLTSGTTDGDNLTTGAGGAWYAIDLTEYSLEASTTYAIVVRAVAGTSTDSLHLRYDGSAATYADGSEINSTNGGVSWSADTDDDLLFETWGSSLLEVTGAQVFRDYLESNDMLFVIQYYNVYVPYYPNADPASYFLVQLCSSDGATVLHQTTCRAWGYKPASIYLSADTAAGLTSGSPYRIYLYGNFTGTPSTYYSLQAADWRGSDLSFLDQWVLTIANDIADYYGVDMTTFLTGGAGEEVLNAEGGVIFSIGIPGLEEIRPDLYEITSGVEGYEATEWSHAFAGDTTWQTQVGTSTASALTNVGTLFGIDGKAIGAFLLLILYLGIAMVVVSKGGDATLAVVLAIPFVLLGVWLRLIDIAIVGVVAAVAVLLLVYRFWWART